MDKRRIISTDKRLRDKIVRFFRENPDEMLTVDDMELKFTGNGTSAFFIEDVVAELMEQHMLFEKNGMYGASEECLAPYKKKKKEPKETAVEKATRILKMIEAGVEIDPDEVLPYKRKNAAKKPKKPPRKRGFLASYWMRENARAPLSRYGGPPLQGVDEVRAFWGKVDTKQDCELWMNVGTGEKKLVKLYSRHDDSWLPLMRSEAGRVSYATHSYTFAVRKC